MPEATIGSHEEKKVSCALLETPRNTYQRNLNTERAKLNTNHHRRDPSRTKDWIYRRGDIYLANLNPFTGSEQGGTRPVLVLQNNDGNIYCPTLIIAPMTTKLKKQELPTHCCFETVKGLPAPSMVSLEQIKTIDKSRVKCYLGRLTRDQMAKVEEACLTSLGMILPECIEAP